MSKHGEQTSEHGEQDEQTHIFRKHVFRNIIFQQVCLGHIFVQTLFRTREGKKESLIKYLFAV